MNLPYPYTQLMLVSDLMAYIAYGENDVDINNLRDIARHMVLQTEICNNNRRGYQYLDKLTQATLANDLAILTDFDRQGVKMISMAF